MNEADFVDCWEADEDACPLFNTPNVSSQGRKVLVEYGRDGDEFDSAGQVLLRTVGLSVYDKDGEMVSSSVEVVPQRQFGLQVRRRSDQNCLLFCCCFWGFYKFGFILCLYTSVS